MLEFANSVAKLCIDKYNSLKKTGKPGDNEWTVLAGIILKKSDNALSLVSLATGTKCLSGVELTDTKLYDLGDRLSDSHAEVVARRGLLLYLYDQYDSMLSSKTSDIFIINTNEIEIKHGVSFHFFCSQTPCGDCSIIPKNKLETCAIAEIPAKKIKLGSETTIDRDEDSAIEINSTAINDIHRTGAKCLKTETKQDPRLSGVDYHVTEALRTKPGRGDPTLSLSCSDKMAKWNAVGIQGSFLSTFIAPLRLQTIVIGGGSPFSQEVMERGIHRRFGDDFFRPEILQTEIIFPHMKNSGRLRPCPSSILWCAVRNKNSEITVDGRKQGATKSKKGNSLLCSRRTFLRTFLKILDKSPFAKDVPLHPKKINYSHCKRWCQSYQDEWTKLKKTKFSTWPEKPAELQNFSL